MQEGKCAELYEKYRIESEIGRGASGVCYRVQNIKTKELFAMKKIHITSIKKHSTKEACSEVSILSKINHPNIIKLLEFFNDDSNIYIIMQFASKGDLHNILKRRRIRRDMYSEAEIWQMSRQMLTAIQYLHNHNIIHRDVKTLNIFLDAHGKLYLGDLGVSKIIKTDSGLYSRVGTPLYLAPEIIKYEKYDFKADIWGLGCVVYQLTTFNHPFEGKNIISLGQNIVSVQPRSIQNYSPEMNSFVMDMLEKNPSKRLSAQELLKKYFQSKLSSTVSATTVVNNQSKELKQIDAIQVKIEKQGVNRIYGGGRASYELKANHMKHRIFNNFMEERFSFNEEDKIKEENVKSPKKVIFKDTRINEKSFEQTIILAKKVKMTEQNKKYVEATHKTFLPAKPQISNDHLRQDITKQELRPQQKLIQLNYGFSSEKKFSPVVHSMPSCKSSTRGVMIPAYTTPIERQSSKKTQQTNIQFNRLPSETHMQAASKISRLRPKSSIMTKERHESTMKNIKRNFKKTDIQDYDNFVEMRFLKKPQMVIL